MQKHCLLYTPPPWSSAPALHILLVAAGNGGQKWGLVRGGHHRPGWEVYEEEAGLGHAACERRAQSAL